VGKDEPQVLPVEAWHAGWKMTKCSRCDEYKKQLDMRDLNTKVWIDADYQTRDYANRLEKQLLLAMVALNAIADGLNTSQDGIIVASTIKNIMEINPDYPRPERSGWGNDKGRK
jgi:hypothetical protein